MYQKPCKTETADLNRRPFVSVPPVSVSVSLKASTFMELQSVSCTRNRSTGKRKEKSLSLGDIKKPRLRAKCYEEQKPSGWPEAETSGAVSVDGEMG